jgi:hypothetical protein
MPWIRWPAALTLVGWTFVPIVFAQSSTPTFSGGVELFTISVHVVAARGKPLPDLTAERFDVSIAGRARRVVFAELIGYDGSGASTGPMPQADRTVLAGDGGVFFTRFTNQASALYVLGIETTEAERGSRVEAWVKANEKNVSVRRWAWCGIPANCRLPAGSFPAWPPAPLPRAALGDGGSR